MNLAIVSTFWHTMGNFCLSRQTTMSCLLFFACIFGLYSHCAIHLCMCHMVQGSVLLIPFFLGLLGESNLGNLR